MIERDGPGQTRVSRRERPRTGRDAINNTRIFFRVKSFAGLVRLLGMPPPRKTRQTPLPPDDDARWTFLSNHSHVLICLARSPDARLRDVAQQVGITERAVQKIVADLEDAGVITRQRVGRRNHYQIHPQAPLRHRVEGDRTIGDLLEFAGT